MTLQKDHVCGSSKGKQARIAGGILAGAAISTIVSVHSANAALVPQGPVVSSSPMSPWVSSQPAGVNAGSVFGIAVAGFNANGSGSYLTAIVDPVFGTTQTFSGDALGGQTLTVTSSESVSGGTTTDLISISVPTNFDPTGTTVGSPAGPVISMEADLGGYNAGPTPLNFSSNVSNATVTGSMIYSGGTFALAPMANDQFTNGGLSLATAEGVNAGGSNLSPFDINTFNFSITYPTPVPEPASGAILLTLAGASVLRRRRGK